MDEIYIYDEGEIISRIVTGRSLNDMTDVAEALTAGATSVFMVCDVNVKAYADKVSAWLGHRVNGTIEIEATEQKKTMDTVMDICGRLLSAGADRNSLLIAVGGGITTDMAGFAASIYRRGIRFAYVPTTLLAQVDAAIGGKTGVNCDSYKNMLGVIRQPIYTLICSDCLSTLSYRNFLSGASEMVKTFLIEDNANYYARAISFLSSLKNAPSKEKFLAENTDELPQLIAAAARVKARVVTEDQFEHGERRKLNLGHTFAHAIEKMAREKQMDITHGEAVAMGIVMAGELTCRLGLAPEGYAAKLKNDIAAAGLADVCPFSPEELAPAMKKDKKADGGAVHFVLVAGTNAVSIKELTVAQVVETLR